MSGPSRGITVVALVASLLLAAAQPVYGLSGAASSERGPAASAQYPNSGVGADQAGVAPSAQAGATPLAEAQQGAASGSGSLPFTGLTVSGIALVGIALLGGGLWLRRPGREGRPSS